MEETAQELIDTCDDIDLTEDKVIDYTD